MANIEDLQKEELINLQVEEVDLEDLIILGDDKLINISVTYPEEKDGEIRLVKTRAKIKQLTIKELKNIDVNNLKLDIIVKILQKALFKRDGTPFTSALIQNMPLGVTYAITKKIMEISGVDPDQLGF